MSSEKTNSLILHEGSGLTLAEILPLYFDAEALVDTPTKLYRIDDGGVRYYFTFDWDTWQAEYYISISGFIQKTLPTPAHLLKWYADLGFAKAESVKKERGDYGTLMHTEFAQFILARKADLDSLPQRVQAYIQGLGLLVEPGVWASELKKDLLAFAQWVVDYDVKPLAIECHLASRSLGFAGILDFVCTMNAQCYSDKTETAKRKRIRAIVDFKGSKSGFYESNEIQLHACKLLWEENMPSHPIDEVYNWAGKDWLKEPTYSFSKHTGKPSERKLPFLVELAKIDDLKPARTLKVMQGELVYGQPIEANFQVVQINDFVKRKLVERQRVKLDTEHQAEPLGEEFLPEVLRAPAPVETVAEAIPLFRPLAVPATEIEEPNF